MSSDQRRQHLLSLPPVAAAPPPSAGRVEARARLLVTVAFLLVLSSFSPLDVLGPLPLALFVVVSLALSALPTVTLGRALLWVAPFALSLAALAPLCDRRPASLLGCELSAGWLIALSICLRLVLAVSAALTLTADLGFHEVARAAGRLGVPRLLVEQMSLQHRYLGVLVGEAERIAVAHRLRAPLHPVPSLARFPTLLGQWLLRTLGRAQRVHVAMVCRGYDGTLPSPPGRSLAWRDWAYLAVWGGFFLLCRAVPLTQRVGEVLVGALR